MWNTPAEFHAAINDLPATLLLASVLLGWVYLFTKKEAIRSVAYWSLVIGAAFAILTVFSGLAAEDWIEHGNEAHRFIERHETLGITMAVIFAGLAIWQIVRKGDLPGVEQKVHLGIGTIALALMMWVSHLGGILVFRQGVGVPTVVLDAALQDRNAGHAHDPGEEHDDEPDAEGEDHNADDHEH